MATEVDRLIVTLEARLTKYNADMTAAQTVTHQKLAAMEARFAQFGKGAAASVGGVGLALGTLGTYITASQFKGYIDGWNRVERTLKGTSEAFGVTLLPAERLADLASDARVDVESYAKTYTRTAAAIRDYGFAAGTAEDVTSTLAKALKLGSANAAEQGSVLLQFSQALQKGKLDGDEFRTVMENAGVVQELLAKRLGVTKSRIIEMAAEGKLKIKDLVGAMTDGKDTIDRIFRGVPATIDEAFIVLNNSVTQYVGNLDKTLGITSKVTSITQVLARNIETVGDVALVTSVALLAMVTPRLLASLGALALSFGAAAGPAGLLIAAVAGGATAFTVMQDDLKVTADRVVSLRDKIDGLRHSMEQANATRLSVKVDMPSTMEGFGVEGDALTGDVRAEGDIIARQIALGRGFANSTKTEYPKKPTADEAEKAKRNAYDRATKDILKRVEALDAEARAVGATSQEQERMRVQQQLMTAAREAELKITPEMLAGMDELARRYGQAAGQLAYLQALQSARDSGEAIKRENELIGLTGVELHRARIAQELFNEARKAGQPITAERQAEIEAIARTNAALIRTGEIMREIEDQSKDAIKGFIADMREGKSAAEAFGGVLNKIADKLIDMAINDLVGAALGGFKAAGGGASLASLFGFADGGVFTPGVGPMPLKTFARGGVSTRAAIFGEAGPEAAVPLPDGRRIPVDLRMPSMPALSSPMPGSVTVAPVFNVQNGTPEGIDKLKGEIVPLMRQVAQTELVTALDRKARFARLKG